MSRSTLHFWIGGDVEIDSAVFKTIAFMMDKGYMTYRDSFDHKGPLLYLINYFGLRISKYSGVWVIEFFAIFVTFYLIYKIGRLCCSKFYAVMILLMVTVPLFDYFHGGTVHEAGLAVDYHLVAVLHAGDDLVGVVDALAEFNLVVTYLAILVYVYIVVA